MHYLQIAFSVILLLGIFALLAYPVLIGFRLTAGHLDKKSAMRKTFITTFIAWLLIISLSLGLNSEIDWGSSKAILLVILTIFISGFVGFFSALSFWYWKR